MRGKCWNLKNNSYLCGIIIFKLETNTIMKELKGTKTEKNLQEAFAGESQARNKYSYWASKAKKDGYVQIAAIFEETANNWRAVASRAPRRT